MANEPEEIDLERGTEWRFELEEGEGVAIRALSDAPIFINYQELPPNTWYPLYGELRGAVWCPEGGRIEVTATPSTCYTSTSSTFPFILSLHLALERLRLLTRRAGASSGAASTSTGQAPGEGPRVMVLGAPNSGKSTMVKSLVNLCLGSGMGWAPGVAGLDPANPPHLVPGSISLSTPTHPLPTHHPFHPLGSAPTTASAVTLSSDISALAWWIGGANLAAQGGSRVNWHLWRNEVEAMGRAWDERVRRDPACAASGLLIDTSPAFTTPALGNAKGDKARYALVRHAIEALQVNVLVVIGNEKLAIEMDKLLQGSGVQIIRATKSSGAVELDEQYRLRIQRQHIRSYFYGEPPIPADLRNLPGKTMALEAPLHPYSFVIGWDDLEIYRVGNEASAPSSALPIGKQTSMSPTRLTKVDPSAAPSIHRLTNAIIALVWVKEDDKLEIAAKDAVKQEPAEATGEGSVKAEDDEGEDGEDEARFHERIAWSDVVGFVSIASIDSAKRKFTILSPSPGKLPSRVAVAGSIEWLEDDE